MVAGWGESESNSEMMSSRAARYSNGSKVIIPESLPPSYPEPVIADVFSEILSRPELCADKIHPNSQGYKQMASGIYAGLKNIGLAR